MKLEICELTAGYGTLQVLESLNLEVPEGKIVTLLGANGSGKSTLLKTVGRLLKPRCGTVLLDGQSVHAGDTRELARQLAVLPQLHQAPEHLTVEELVKLGRFPHRREAGRDRAAVERALQLTRLERLRHRTLGTLSGGERQRAWIALTLAQEPRVLLLDEPTTYLDIRGQFEVLELVRQLRDELALTVLMVLHDLNLAARVSDCLVTLKDGRIHRFGTPREVLTVAELRAVFGVEALIALDETGIPNCIPVGAVRERSGE